MVVHVSGPRQTAQHAKYLRVPYRGQNLLLEEEGHQETSAQQQGAQFLNPVGGKKKDIC